MEIQSNPQIFDVNQENFEETVLKGSQERVIVVDLWAPWCEPCKTLGPIIEEVVTELGPGIALAKINVDENPALSQAFRVQGIPAVKIIKDGQLVQEFSGALPKEQIDAILRPLVDDAPTAPEEDLLEQAAALAEMGDTANATRLYQQALEDEPQNGQALLGLARLRLSEGQVDELEALIDRIETGTPEKDQGKALLAQAEFGTVCAQAGGRAACAQTVLANSDDLDARYALACCMAAGGDHGSALAEWLKIVEQKKDYKEGAAKEAMVSIFRLLGRHNDIVADYPQRLNRALH
ncbi:MAG: tetratricopeptide repeat protein [Candidatus Latescibacteria bacterium]|nr:tetratricopeptide repeat protein [Candidatus Latescibacterota bacterium]